MAMATPLAPIMNLRSEAAWYQFKALFTLFKLSSPTVYMRQLVTVDYLDLVSFLLKRASLTLEKATDAELVKLFDAHFAPVTTIELCQRLQRLNYKGEIASANMATYCSSFKRVLVSADSSLQPRKAMLFKLFSDGLASIPPLVEELSLMDAHDIDMLITHAYDFVDRARKSNLLSATSFEILRQNSDSNHNDDSHTTTPMHTWAPVSILKHANTPVPTPADPASPKKPDPSGPWEARLRNRPTRAEPTPAEDSAPLVRVVRLLNTSPEIPTPRPRMRRAVPDTVTSSTSAPVPRPRSEISLCHSVPQVQSETSQRLDAPPITEPIIPVRLQSQVTTNALLDTGSTINVIRRDVLQCLPPDQYRIRYVPSQALQFGDGNATNTLNEQVDLQLSFRNPHDPQGHSCILTTFYVIDQLSDPIILSHPWMYIHRLHHLLTYHADIPPISPPKIYPVSTIIPDDPVIHSGYSPPTESYANLRHTLALTTYATAHQLKF